ncbi:MAG TPA: periplasmic heavy metal sensor [Kofleriaceae bacterium]|nr:periplasmic heavy metal sensor [Kofleriaceae bacterium]
MVGCIILSAFLAVMAVKLIAHRRCWAGGHGHWGHRGRWGGPWGGPWHGFGPGPSSEHLGNRWSYWLLASLDLSPAQEKVVRSELETLKQKVRTVRDESAASRADMARAVRGEDFEEEALASMFIRHDDHLHTLRQDLGGALGRIHSVLDPAQRERLAAMIEKGPRAASWGGPYR